MTDSRTTGYNLLTLPQKALLIAGVIVALILLGLLAAPYVPPMRDYDQTFYPASRYLLAGQNPYTADYTETDQGAPPSFFSPAWFLVILLPFGLLPFELARAEWMVFLVVVTFASIYLMGWWGLKGPWALALAALPWSLIAILYGQATPLVLFGALLAITQIATAGETRRSAGLILLGLILMGIKPQLALFIGLPLGLWLLWRRDRRLWPVVAGGLAFLLLVWLLSPPWPIASAIEIQKITAPHWKSTLERELWLWQWPAWIAHLVRLGVVAVMAGWAWREGDLTPAWWSAMLAAALIITPYTRAYDGILLLPLLGQMIARQRLRFLVFLVVVFAYTGLPLGELGSVVTPLAAWLLFVPWSRLRPGGVSA